MISKDTAERSDRYFKYVVIKELLFFSFPKGGCYNTSNGFILNFWFEAGELLSGSIIVKLSLFEGKDIQDISAFELLLVQISDSICCFLSLTLFDNVNVAGVLEIRLKIARKRPILDKRLRFL